MVAKTCQQCGRAIEVSQKQDKQGKGKYCSRQCAGKAKASTLGHKRNLVKQGMGNHQGNADKVECEREQGECLGRKHELGASHKSVRAGQSTLKGYTWPAPAGEKTEILRCYQRPSHRDPEKIQATRRNQPTDDQPDQTFTATATVTAERQRGARQKLHHVCELQQSFALDCCPWAEGVLSPVRYDQDYHMSPDIGLGY